MPMTRLEQIRSLACDCTDQERATIVFKLMNAEWGTYSDELDEMFHDAFNALDEALWQRDFALCEDAPASESCVLERRAA